MDMVGIFELTVYIPQDSPALTPRWWVGRLVGDLGGPERGDLAWGEVSGDAMMTLAAALRLIRAVLADRLRP